MCCPVHPASTYFTLFSSVGWLMHCLVLCFRCCVRDDDHSTHIICTPNYLMDTFICSETNSNHMCLCSLSFKYFHRWKKGVTAHWECRPWGNIKILEGTQGSNLDMWEHTQGCGNMHRDDIDVSVASCSDFSKIRLVHPNWLYISILSVVYICKFYTLCVNNTKSHVNRWWIFHVFLWDQVAQLYISLYFGSNYRSNWTLLIAFLLTFCLLVSNRASLFSRLY